MIKPAKNEL